MSSIFLAHSSADKAFAKKLSGSLRDRGIAVWIDEAEIRVGDSLFDRIAAGISTMKYLGVILSPASTKSKWVRREVEIALSKEIDGDKVVVLPILYKRCQIPAFLQSKLYADFSSPGSFQLGLGILLSRLLELEDGHIMQKAWHPKAVRFGLKVGLLRSTANGLEFSRSFRRNLNETTARYLIGGLKGADHFGVAVMMAIGSTLAGKNLPLYDEDLHFLANELILDIVRLCWEAALQAKILVGGDQGTRVDPSIEEELFDEATAIFAPEDAPSQDARRIFNMLLNEVIFTRLAILRPEQRDLAPVLSSLLFDSVYKNFVAGLQERAWEK